MTDSWVEEHTRISDQFVDKVAERLLDHQHQDRPDGMSAEQWRWNSLESLTNDILSVIDGQNYIVGAIQPDPLNTTKITVILHPQPRLSGSLDRLRAQYTQEVVNDLPPPTEHESHERD